MSSPRNTAQRAIVTSVSPLRVRPVGSSSDAPALSLNGFTPSAVGVSVAYVTFDGRLLVLGTAS